MTNIDPAILNIFVAGCHRAGAAGLLRCSSGNMSLRVGDDEMLVSARGSWLEELTDDQVVHCCISSGEVLNGKEASVETGLHRGVLQGRPDVSCVLHCQTPCATTLGCRDGEVPAYDVIPEIPFYIGAIADVPYIMPGSTDLAAAVTEAMATHDLAQLRHHGQVVAGSDPNDVIQKGRFFELACEIVLHGGDSVRPLSEGDIARLQGKGIGA